MHRHVNGRWIEPFLFEDLFYDITTCKRRRPQYEGDVHLGVDSRQRMASQYIYVAPSSSGNNVHSS